MARPQETYSKKEKEKKRLKKREEKQKKRWSVNPNLRGADWTICWYM